MAPQDSFIDDEEESCPLCVEEFDLSDKNFRPCPCGYQICQFCFNNIKTNLNALCPACRRPYDEKTIEWKVVSPEEQALFKANVQKNAKKKAEQRQKEAQKREVENLNRKHLSGLRVVQRNLVYVVGLNPSIQEKEILNTLRGDDYFGQYGKILKIVVSKSKSGEVAPNGTQGLGVYVTFARKEDAQKCIAAVNGSQNGDRVLRAQLGTTKYCSAFLRGEICTNKSCMFLHEDGDNDDSYSRQDLSSLNSVNTQRPLQSIASSSGTSSRQIAQMQAPIPQAHPIAAATQPMARESSKDGSDSGDGSALPSAATWATRGMQQRSRRGSHATSGATSSPAISQAMPVTAEVVEEPSNAAPVEVEPEVVQPLPAAEPPVPAGPPKPERDRVIINLLKSINLTDLSFPNTTQSDDKFPPLFDHYGGEKRYFRQMQEDEERSRIKQEAQEEEQSVPEPVEEEAPESGSFQLGGEPEDRDIDREPPSFTRRPSAQLPIQRTSNAPVGLLGNFSRNIGSLSTINGRSLTPQQQLLLSQQQQNTFMEQYSPGISGGQTSGLFHQQGHNRQSSRYNFTGESGSGSSIKPSANPKLMAQQSSMMPNHQASNQFYGSSIQGPPPGLKSTGTPPIGGMFGQGHGFGGSMGNTAFGAKENNNDMLRDMLRGRGNLGGQSHDIGKREFNFPSFLQQYPSASSTPAPASSSGIMPSLYGSHNPGAFHDFNQKQKKKGKKHRHANTSSSGGGGLVDLVDPSILQARMQHQQQSNAGVGQGLFGGQAQDDEDLPGLDDATLSVDALVADSTADTFGPRLPSVYDMIGSRSSTPSIPPGFGLPHAHPPPPSQEPAIKPSSRITPNAPPFTPSRTSSFIAQTVTPFSVVVTPEILKKRLDSSTSQAKQDVKAFATNSGLSKAIVAQASQALQPEDFPTLASSSAKTPATPVPSKSSTSKTPSTPAVKQAITSAISTPTVAPPIAPRNDKRPQPGILNISVPSKPAVKPAAAAPETPSKPVVASSAFPPLPASTPSVQSPFARNVPKTLRLFPSKAEKVETPTAGSVTPTSVISAIPPQLPIRQASLTSIPRHERPGSPANEASDIASVTSTSLSRASSPPPSRIGSAPVRTTTKAALKKARKEAHGKSIAEEAAAVAAKKIAEPEEVGPIMGRKKKQKKEISIHSAAGGSTPAASRPASPGLIDAAQDDSVTTNEKATANDAAEKNKQNAVESDVEALKPSKAKGKGKNRSHPAPPPPPAATVEAAVEVDDEPEALTTEIAKPQSIPTPANTLNDLIAANQVPAIDKLAIFKLPTTSAKFPGTAEMNKDGAPSKLTITPEDRSALLAGKPVHKNQGTPHPTMLTPNGDYVRYLSPEEEQRYLYLQKQIANDTGPGIFISAKHHASNGFTLIGGRAVPNGPPSFFPPPIGTGLPLDPVSKIQRDEALSYINQYVLPSLSTNSQLEKALNANALDAEMLRSSDPLSFPSWGNDPAGPRAGGSHDNSHEGILATGLEGMTAHFAVGRDGDSGRPLGNVSLLSLPEAETGMQSARKEADALDKKLQALMKKNRRILLAGSSH